MSAPAINTLPVFRYRTLQVVMQPSACAASRARAHQGLRKGGFGALSKASNPQCRDCPVGVAHAAGELPDTWPDGAPIERSTRELPVRPVEQVSNTSSFAVPTRPRASGRAEGELGVDGASPSGGEGAPNQPSLLHADGDPRAEDVPATRPAANEAPARPEGTGSSPPSSSDASEERGERPPTPTGWAPGLCQRCGAKIYAYRGRRGLCGVCRPLAATEGQSKRETGRRQSKKSLGSKPKPAPVRLIIEPRARIAEEPAHAPIAAETSEPVRLMSDPLAELFGRPFKKPAASEVVGLLRAAGYDVRGWAECPTGVAIFLGGIKP